MRKILHVDMDAFFAAVEIRDNPALAGKPLIIGALPNARGVVSTCSYEARKYGIHSAMSIQQAYRRCPHGVYLRPNMHKYKTAAQQIRAIWASYTDIVEYVALDEGYLDVTGSAHLFGGAAAIADQIRARTREELGLTCSVGLGYCMMAAKLASEENKPDGFFAIPDPESFRNLVVDRRVGILLGVGKKTAEALQKMGIHTVRDLYANRQLVADLLDKQGERILSLADGIDPRRVTPDAARKSMGKEHTFQQDIVDFAYLRDVLRLTAKALAFEMHKKALYCQTITLKVTYGDMQQITRSISGEATNRSETIYQTAASLLDKIEKRPVRLVGISLSGLVKEKSRQLSLFDADPELQMEKLDDAMFRLQQRYSIGIVKTASELRAEKHLRPDDEERDE